ncbi:MAG: hypothetical protein IPK13_06215 [Deltaproteobacteria bacterium]|nr:hypothetical protein [Deltaproteobacteria bacterium]
MMNSVAPRRAIAGVLAGVWLSATPVGRLAWADEPSTDVETKRGPGTARDKDCLVCHAGVGEEDAPKLDLERYGASVHNAEGCVGCHADVFDESIHHEEEDQDLAPVDCAGCHSEPGDAWARSVHGETPADPDQEQATCVRCHGVHDTLSPKDPRSMVHPLRQLETCGQCHGLDRAAAGHALEVPLQYRRILKNASQELVVNLMRQGVLVSAGCSDCHGSHAVHERTSPDSTLYPANVESTCRPCHQEQSAQYRKSAHGQASSKSGFSWRVNASGEVPSPGEYAATVLDDGAGRDGPADPTQPPVCTTCHGMHANVTPKTDRFRLDIVRECGTCHARLMETYTQSYHGKATLLGDASVAKCSDCHTAHQNLPASDPDSTVSPKHRSETCRKCHAGAPEKFAEFWPHADHHDREKYPVLFYIFLFMSALLVSVFTFFGLHTILWGIRDAVDAFRERKLPRRVHAGADKPVVRFSRFDRILHFFVIISFLGLAATGAPLKFAHTAWAKAFFEILGGVSAAGWWHRVFAIITFGYFSSHIIHMATRLMRLVREGRLARTLIGPDSLVPGLQDVVDIFKHTRYFLGLGPRPTWERWTYWEKFDYWSVFWGVSIIGSSGLILWFPEVFTHILPGWAVNIALVVHSDEALLAIGFIFGVHFFNSHLRRSKFPMDSVIFVGTVPEGEYREERGREWARLEQEGRIEARRGSPPNPIFLKWVRVFGMSAWIFGLLILALIVHGFFFAKS